MVKRLEAGGLTLEQSLELWERGERLATVCGEWLDGARARLAAAMATRETRTRPETPTDSALLSRHLLPACALLLAGQRVEQATARWAR